MSFHDSPGPPHRRPLAALTAAVLLYGCVSSVAQQGGTPPTQPTPNYRGIIARNLKAKEDFVDPTNINATYIESRGGIFPSTAKVDSVQISDSIKMVQTMYHGWAWQTCLKANVNGAAVTYAVFISGNRLVDARSAIIVDNCDKAHYDPPRGAVIR
ncbi:MAG TPA: hypothetical protein VEJ40_03350 [Pseudolabrys sp.]|nr:hypothetical protein [Pseudolabrys sp.]